MKILVTGYKGFIGQNMVKALSSHVISTFEWGEPVPCVKDVDVVMHLGAISATTEQNVEKILTQNYDFSKWVLNECIKHRVHMQYSSSASVYGLKQEFSENSPFDPKSPYAWSKYLFDRHVLELLESNKLDINVQGFRYFNVYGPHEDHKKDQASPYYKFTQQAKTTGVIKLFEGSDKLYRDFVPVSTVVDAHIRFLDVNQSGIWNVGTGTVMSFERVAQDIAREYNAKIEYIPMPEVLKPQYQAYTKADMTKFVNTLAKHDLTAKKL